MPTGPNSEKRPPDVVVNTVLSMNVAVGDAEERYVERQPCRTSQLSAIVKLTRYPFLAWRGARWHAWRLSEGGGLPLRVLFRVLAVGGLAAMLLGGQPAQATTEEVIVQAPMPSNCTQDSDGKITCDGMTLEAWCEQNANADHVICGGSGGGGGGGGGSGGGGGGGGSGDGSVSNLEKECAAEGGEWVNGGCEFPPPEPEDDSADGSDDPPALSEAEVCEQGGGTWNWDYCDQIWDKEGAKFVCTCWVHGALIDHGQTTFPACMAQQKRHINSRDETAACYWD